MTTTNPSATLTHADDRGVVSMVDVGDKTVGDRRAQARCTVHMLPTTARLVWEGRAAKGEVLATCRIAGILAAKRTADLIPLTHQISLAHVSIDINVDVDAGAATICCSVRTVSGTGVEIEALTGASMAAVTLYDMIKAVDRGARIDDLRVIAKSGGRSGDFVIDSQTGELTQTSEVLA